jgi:hypothetical protein
MGRDLWLRRDDPAGAIFSAPVWLHISLFENRQAHITTGSTDDPFVVEKGLNARSA